MKVRKLEAVRTGANSVKAYVKAVKNGWNIAPSEDSPELDKNNCGKTAKIFDSPKEAVEYARNVALEYQNEFSLHGGNGKIKEKFVHGDYSFPPRG